MAARKARHAKRKSMARMANAPQDEDDFEPSEEFVQMLLAAMKRNEWYELDVDDMPGQFRATTELAEQLEVLKRDSQKYLEEIGAPKDEDEATTRLLRAAGRGDVAAQRHLGVMYITRSTQVHDEPDSVRDKFNAYMEQSLKDDADAMFWFGQAAEQGCSDSAFMVGLMYDAARGATRDHAEAAQWIQKAASLGSDAAKKWLAPREG